LVSNELQFVAGIGIPPGAPLTPGMRLSLSQTLIGECARGGEPLVIDDLSALPDRERAMQAVVPGLRAIVWLPLLVQGQVIGALGLGNREPGFFGGLPLAPLAALSSQAALAIENARLYQQAEERLARLSSLYAVAQALSASIDLQPVIEAVVDVATEQTSFPIAALALMQPQTRTIEIAGFANVPESLRPYMGSFSIDGDGFRPSVTRRVMATHAPVYRGDVGAELEPGPSRDGFLATGMSAYACVPLVARGRFEGALFVFDTRARPDVSAHLPLLTALADQAAVAIANARLFESMEDSLRQTRALQRVTTTMATSLDLQEILGHALAAAMQLFAADRAGIYLTDQQTGEVRCVASHGLSAEYLRRVAARYQDRISATTARLRVVEHLYIEDATSDPNMTPLREAAEREGFRSMLFVSLRYPGSQSGMFVLYHDKVRPYADDEIGLARTFAEQAAIAIEHARLFEESRRLAVVDERNRLARELHDSVTQSLFSMSMITQALPELLDKRPDRVRERLERLAELSRGALAEMRSLLFELRPAALEQEGLEAALAKYAAAFQSREGIQVELRSSAVRRLTLDEEEALYRIAQEALNNVLKHASAATVVIDLAIGDAGARLCVRDNGVGFDRNGSAGRAEGAPGFGMTSMQERARLCGGRAWVESQPGAGTAVHVELGPPGPVA